jgi:hypothetical protein
MNSHRQIIVAGASTAGKSTFSDLLVRKFYLQHIQIDPIIEGFEDVFPELGITHKALNIDDHLQVCEKFRPFILRVIEGLRDSDFVIEGFRMPIEALYEKFGSTHQFFVFGFPQATAQEKVARSRSFDVANWGNGISLTV